MPTGPRSRATGRLRAIMFGLSLAALVLAFPVTAALAQDADEVGSGEEPVSFTDTEDGSQADAIQELAADGVVQGCEEDQFCPTDLVMRGQLASMLAAALDLDSMPEGPFDDVDGSVHAAQINVLHSAGVVNGCGEEAFCPAEIVTRGQVATMLAEAFELPVASQAYFDDTAGVHGESIDRMAAAGFAAGCGDPLTHFCADSPVTRGQAAMFLARAMGLVPPVEITPLEQRREEQAVIDAERAAEAARQAELEAEREAERQAALEAEREAAREQERRAAEQRAAERLAMWESLAQCESGGNWSINTGNGYYGGLQFLLQTWQYVGGSGYPHQATKEEQIYRAERLLEYSWASFSNQWPACSRKLGLG